jgi:hypothetical protein
MNRKFLALFTLSPLAILFAADSQTTFKYPPAVKELGNEDREVVLAEI